MVLEELASPRPVALEIRRLGPAERRIHVELAAAGFGARPELFDRLISEQVLELPEVRCYAGWAEGVPVTTALAFAGPDHVGVYNVATPAAYRGRGYGAAVTGRAVADGLAAGAAFAYLQSSELGFGVYERLGFIEVERWEVWTEPAD
jgi:ribosomal protein S18 acetylase RimI-like enzyme